MVRARDVRMQELMQAEKSGALTVDHAGMHLQTPRRHAWLGKLPSNVRVFHRLRTREDLFHEGWQEIAGMLEVSSGLRTNDLV